ncbi:hypothetical protein LZ012_16050 [Dechloromonas sp. XY25]|uniref:DUF2868 domain-containing protein n=1 Tax=Dechloromonas hankyongensis TaxID=2908002 RepID=A0ABS9K5S5_9RHOO|nr:hypothetical protein [Dechloromonas hankyongensis]MCG2578509.1 hypothetical protein [Dechloromonas hankyongensis]
MLPGKIAFLLIVATALSFFGALIVAARYRAAMQALMKAPLDAPSTTTSGTAKPLPYSADTPAIPVSLADNRQAQTRLILGFLGLTLLMALTRTLLMQIVSDGPITIKTVSTLCAAYAWPVVPVIAVLRRWPRWRFVGVLLLWFVAAVMLLSWRTNENVSFAQVLFWLSLDIGLPLIVVSALCLGSATRAVAPWLAPLFILFCWASQAGVDLLAALVDAQSPLAYWLAGHIGAITAIALFALTPWLFAWWPARALGRWLADAYAARRISELFYLFTAVWVIALVGPALGAIASEGWGALLYFLPLAWVPLAGWLLRQGAAQRPAGRPPTLLVLRVFQQDANVQNLFDGVIERWRLSGNTVLIAGTDLIDRTIDAEDIFTFLDGRLAERFIRRPEEVGHRLGAFEWQPDVEGRYRVNECYCHDTTWQQALAELLRVSDVVLMDLRNFVAANRGCLYELQTLAALPALQRVVVLVNERTEVEAARAATAAAPAGRFVWLRQANATPPAAEEVLAALLD